MTTVSKRKPLQQPPHYGRIGAQADHTRPCPVQAAAERAVGAAQFERQIKTTKHGSRAVVG